MDDLLKKRAEKVRDALVEHYQGYWRDLGDYGLGPDYPKPKVVEDDTDGGALIVWEEGPEDWPLLLGGGTDEFLRQGILEFNKGDEGEATKLAQRKPVDLPEGIEVEAHTSYALKVR